MIFPLFRNRRKELLAAAFPDAWSGIITANVHHFQRLSSTERDTLRAVVQVLMAEKNWEGCAGLVLNETIQVTIAAQAALPLIGMEHDFYGNVESILVYPAAYVATDRVQHPGMVITESPSLRLGEAWTRGPVILSWPDALAGGRNETDGHNVVIHEFAHKLDFRDGSGDGVPHLHTRQQYDRWSSVMSGEYQSLVTMSETGQATIINKYGATSPAEFFAVTTECFFERPVELRHLHPTLYEVLMDYFGQDTASRATYL